MFLLRAGPGILVCMTAVYIASDSLSTPRELSSVTHTRLSRCDVQLLQTYSLNVGDELRGLLVSDHLFNTLLDIQSGLSNTLAAGLAQLLYDWKHMCGYESAPKLISYMLLYITG